MNCFRPSYRGAGVVALLVLAVFGACRRVSPAQPVAIDVVSGEQVIDCRVDVTQRLGPVHRGLFGTNLEWFNHANGLADDTGRLDGRLVQLAKEQGTSIVRFPGGTLSDFYHWRDGVGPVSQRPTREHPTDPGRSPNIFGTPEFARFCQEIGADPLITVNAGTGTAADAAAWVAYCNAPRHDRRAADGLAAPLNVKWWEIGNELYLPGNPGDKKIITVTPDIYATRFREFATAMRTADPSIRLMAIATANPTRLPLPYPDWTKKILERAADQIDSLAVHCAYFPYLANEKNPPIKDVYQTLWAAPEAVDRVLTQLSDTITKAEKGRHIGIAITEWGLLFSIQPEWVDHIKTMGSAVYAARLMQVFLNQPRVDVANYFKFTDRSCMGWVSYEKVPKIPYYVIQLFARHYGSERVAASVEHSPTFNSRTLGATVGESNVPEVTATASIDAAGRKLFINVVNRSWNTAHPLRINLRGARLPATATAWSISSPGVTDHNGRDLPPEFPVAWQEPALSTPALPPVTITSKTISLETPVRLPPFSILTLEADLLP